MPKPPTSKPKAYRRKTHDKSMTSNNTAVSKSKHSTSNTVSASASKLQANKSQQTVNKAMTLPRYWLVKLLLVLLLCVVGFVSYALYMPINMHRTVFVVEPNSSYNQIIDTLDRKGKLVSPFVLKVYRKLFIDENLKIGEYDIPSRISPARLLQYIGGKGHYRLLRVQIIEGKRVSQLRAMINDNPKVIHTTHGLSDADLLQMLDPSATNPPPFIEGMFAPNTYYFSNKVKDIEIYQRLYNDQQAVLNQAWDNRAANVPYANKWELLTMASIIEKETNVAEERTRIAGVFVTRLQQGMKLQTDPTVIYGMGSSYRGNISRADLRRATPYNTYVIDGLPPTPIALPSKASIEAAANPDLTGDLFFVATGVGGHTFSKTYAQHKIAVDKYWALIKQRQADKAAQQQEVDQLAAEKLAADTLAADNLADDKLAAQSSVQVQAATSLQTYEVAAAPQPIDASAVVGSVKAKPNSTTTTTTTAGDTDSNSATDRKLATQVKPTKLASDVQPVPDQSSSAAPLSSNVATSDKKTPPSNKVVTTPNKATTKVEQPKPPLTPNTPSVEDATAKAQ